MPLFLSIAAAVGISIATAVTGFIGDHTAPKEKTSSTQNETSISSSIEGELDTTIGAGIGQR